MRGESGDRLFYFSSSLCLFSLMTAAGAFRCPESDCARWGEGVAKSFGVCSVLRKKESSTRFTEEAGGFVALVSFVAGSK